MTELHGEKIDIVDYSPDPAEFVAHALSPARVSRVIVVDPQARVAQVIVPDYQLSLAIGKEGQNARLAARLTGWRIDIRPDTAAADPAASAAPEDAGDAGPGSGGAGAPEPGSPEPGSPAQSARRGGPGVRPGPGERAGRGGAGAPGGRAGDKAAAAAGARGAGGVGGTVPGAADAPAL